ncbi:MAG: pentapeptide repeat-containing protein, partial [Bacteroidota bacterium]
MLFVLVLGTGYVLSAPLHVGMKAAVVVGLLLIFVAFPWLLSRRDPDGHARRKGGLLLITGGIGLLSHLLATGIGFSLELFGQVIDFSLVPQGRWWIDLILGVSAIAMFAFGYMLLRPSKEPEDSFAGNDKTSSAHPERVEDQDSDEIDEFVRPEAYSPPPQPVFWRRVHRLFELRSFSRYREFGDINEAGCIVGKQYRDDGNSLVVVRCDDRGEPVQAEDVERLRVHAKSVSTHSEDEYPLSMFYVVPDSASLSTVDQVLYGDVSFKSESELLDELVHFEPYLRRIKARYDVEKLPYSLREEAEQKTLAETFVQPRFSLSDGQWDHSLDDYLDSWLIEPGARHLALLGDYGMGKSSFVKHFAARQATAWLGGDRTTRIPLLLELAGKSPRTDENATGLLSRFIDENALGCGTEALRYLMREGRLVVLLDGFDEMDLIGDREQRARHFEVLWTLAEHGNKLMISGRPGYFPTGDELTRILKVADQRAKRGTGARYCTRINLDPFEDEDVAKAFALYFGDEKAEPLLSSLEGRRELADLVRRPALMHIVRETLSAPEDKAADTFLESSRPAVKPADLLRTYTEHWIVRDREKPRKQLVSSEDRLKFSEELAAWMTVENRTEVDSEEIFEQYQIWFPKDTKLANSDLSVLEGLKADLRTCSFMVPTGDRGFKFAHMPFMEYFVASWLVDHLVGSRQESELPLSIRRRPWRPEIARHVADLLIQKVSMDELSKLLWGKVSLKRMESAFSFSTSGPRAALGQDQDTQEANQLAFAVSSSPLFNITQVELYAGVLLRKTRLYKQIQPSISRRFLFFGRRLVAAILPGFSSVADAVFSGKDIVLRSLDFTGTDLKDIDLSNADLKGSELTGADLRHTKLNGADLSLAKLDGTDLSGANLRKTKLNRADLRHTKLNGADLSLAELTGADLRGQDLRQTKLSRADLRHTKLNGADLRNQDLSYTKLNGADLSLAKLDGTDLSRADLRQTKLSRADLRQTKLSRADLRYTKLNGADLRNQDLSYTKLSRADLRHTKLNGADLSL